MSLEPRTIVGKTPGLVEYFVQTESVRKTVINPASPQPAKERESYSLPVWLLGKLEILGQSRFEVSDLTKMTQEQLNLWSIENEDDVLSIVKSVNASSRIEGEGMKASDVPMVFHAITRSTGQSTAELKDRALAEKDIALGYFWALSQKRDPIISFDFILELHKRMFLSTKGEEIAGKIKIQPVIIADDERIHFDVTTLPPEKAERFLRVLCERFTSRFQEAERYGRNSKLILIAEFIVDFLAIHPFEDGNGRTARLLSTYLIERAGYHFARFYSLDQVILDSRNDYFKALFAAQSKWYQKDEDLVPWIIYYVNAIFKQWERAFSEIRDRAMKRQEKESLPS
jgi:Fic family protein